MRGWFASEAPRSLLHGAFEPLGGGRVRLTYDFDDAAELNDFVEFEYLESIRKSFGPVRAKERVGFQHERGAIVAIGEACARHVLGFQSPMTVTCRFSYVRRVSDDDLWRFSLGACGDWEGLSFVRTFDLDGLAVGDAGSYENKMSTPRVGVLPKKNYEIGLRNDGETVTTFLDGDDMQSLPVGAATSGNVFLFVHSDRPIRVDRLVIEGTIDPEGLERSRAEWVRGKVADL